MPTKPKHPCSFPGCQSLTATKRCAEHTKVVNRESESRRLSANERGYTSRWSRASKSYLQSNPLCVICYSAGQLTPATLTDHIIPHKGDWSLFWDESNWQALCDHCHAVKTAKEDGGFGNKRR